MSVYDLLADVVADKQRSRALRHTYPSYEPPENDPLGEPVEMWFGKMRIVRSRKRMRKLKRRGVPMKHLGYGSGFELPSEYAYDKLTGQRLPLGPWAWFVERKTRYTTSK